MPLVNHVVEYEPPNTYRAAVVRGVFDFQASRVTREWSVEVPDESEQWGIGVIVGPSGSGKSQIARRAFGISVDIVPQWRDGVPIVESFPASMDVSAICELLSRVGLGSVPAWMLPYAALSNGQRFRADMARRIAEHESGILVVDEFSSVVDRAVAKTTSAVMSKCVRSKGLRFVAVTCHYDVIEWLCPDWVLDMADGKLARGGLWRRPSISVEIGKCARSAWGLFKMHHYLNADLPRQATCYAAEIEGRPVAFVATIPYPHKQYGRVTRISRVVTLPDYQGLGLALRMLREIAEHIGGRVYISTSHAPFARSLRRSGEWRCCRERGFAPPNSKTAMPGMKHRTTVLTAGFLFRGNEI
jgi:ABC-type dipeptide/oligopeptide/nickel transport system ATPase subunit/GNAT superfamily N-acetyltransferase